MLPFLLIVLGVLITLVRYLPPAWVRTLYRFTPTVRQRALASVLGLAITLVGVVSANLYWLALAPTKGQSELSSTITTNSAPIRSVNKAMDDEIQKAWQELKDGRIAYEPSRLMTEGNPEVVRVRIARGDTIDTKSGFSNEAWVERLKISGFMTASLNADANDFEIVALSSESQALVGDFTDWVWRVTPLRVGDLALRVRVTARIRLSDGSTEVHDLLVKDARINVKSNPQWRLTRFWDRNRQWILGSPMVVGLATWAGARILKKRRTKRRIGFRPRKP